MSFVLSKSCSDAKHYELKLASEVRGRLPEANAALAGKPTDPEVRR